MALYLSVLLTYGRRHQLYKLQAISSGGHRLIQTQHTASQNPLSTAMKYFWLPDAGFAHLENNLQRSGSQKKDAAISYLTCSTLALCQGHDALGKKIHSPLTLQFNVQ